MEALINYLWNVHKVKPWQFARWPKEKNMLPIGTRSAYRLCRKKKVSKAQYLLIKDFLDNVEWKYKQKKQ